MKASIVIATYNGQRFLEQQLTSLLDQNYNNIEIIISDDNSNDDTISIAKKILTKKDIDFKIISNPYGLGFINNFRNAIEHSTGDIVFLCDQDDIWYSDKVSKHMSIYENDLDVCMVYNKVSLTDEENNKIGTLEQTIGSNYYTQKRSAASYTWGSCILGCATSYRYKSISGIWPADQFAPAHDSWIQLLLSKKKHIFLDQYLQDYRQHADNVFGIRKNHSNDTTEAQYRAIRQNFKYIKSLILNKIVPKNIRAYLVMVLMFKIIKYKYINN